MAFHGISNRSHDGSLDDLATLSGNKGLAEALTAVMEWELDNGGSVFSDDPTDATFNGCGYIFRAKGFFEAGWCDEDAQVQGTRATASYRRAAAANAAPRRKAIRWGRQAGGR